MIRCAVFDFDGTLVDSNPTKVGSFYAAARALDPEGALVDVALARPDKGDRSEITRFLAERLAERGRIPPGRVAATARDLCARYTRLCAEGIAACAEVPGASAALSDLAARGLPLFVNSGTPEEPLRRAVAGRGLDAFFAGVFGAPGTKGENLARAAADAGARPSEVLFVGDGEDDRSAALAFGCVFVGIELRESRFARPPARSLPDLRSLLPLLDAWEADARRAGAR